MTKMKKTDPNLVEISGGFPQLYNTKRPDNVLCKHPVHHDDHGAHQLESSAEEEEVGTRAGHDDDG